MTIPVARMANAKMHEFFLPNTSAMAPVGNSPANSASMKKILTVFIASRSSPYDVKNVAYVAPTNPIPNIERNDNA